MQNNSTTCHFTYKQKLRSSERLVTEPIPKNRKNRVAVKQKMYIKD